jgi:2-keto-myo-inositol isomerase
MPHQMRFALNHMVAPRASLDAFFDMAASLGVRHVEIRNDLAGIAIGDGTEAEVVRSAAQQRGLRLLSINALQRFNDWTPERAVEARRLAVYARDCGAEALVLCPVNDWSFRPGEGPRLDGLRRALAEVAPVLAEHRVTGLVEPLGFPESSLRFKREAVEAIDKVGAGKVFRLVHDTFHHAIAGDDEMFPEHTGLVHASGVVAPDVPLISMRDHHRVLVDAKDRLGNAEQIELLTGAGYSGFISFEPFADTGLGLDDTAGEIRKSIAFLSEGRKSAAA